MKIGRAGCVAIALLFAVTANEVGATDACTNLERTPAPSRDQMMDCAVERHDQADKALNAAYSAVMTALREREAKGYSGEDWRGSAEALREAQRAWIKYRDANCDWVGSFFGEASLDGPRVVLGCKTELTSARTKEIKSTMASFQD